MIKSDVNKISLLLLCILFTVNLFAQTDTGFVPVDTVIAKSPITQYKSRYDSVNAVHSPKKAIFRSAVLPGWGQAYNKKYWKIPIIYGALGVGAGVFLYNLNNYKATRLAYRAKYNASQRPPDSSEFHLIRPDLVLLDVQSLRYYRDEFRRNIDYSVIFFLVLWGLNVADAAVDAHLRSFDVSPDLSFRFKPGRSQFANTTGVSFVLAFK
ncbi:MAG TPA: DUF5683 domain-containing protein [Flavisolibacter sp.]|nr:DUF5683 domain-containing protein [Flavisolibacter sp.]